jgi:hypothetical protein
VGTNVNYCPYLNIGLGTRLLGNGCASKNCSYPTPYPASAKDVSSNGTFLLRRRRFSRDGTVAPGTVDALVPNGLSTGGGVGWSRTEGDDDDDISDEGAASTCSGREGLEAALLLEASRILRRRQDGTLGGSKDDDDSDDDAAAAAEDDESAWSGGEGSKLAIERIDNSFS